jgi:hypothetical protein
LSDSPPPPELQFDRAEFKGDSAPVTCASCGAAIRSAYYQVGQAITCEQCRWRLESDGNGGSSVGRFLKATVLGAAAAAVGGGLYFAVLALTGYEFGLIAIVVGFLVGGAVRTGSERRGGAPYQALAMLLTYASIVSTYIPDILEGFRAEGVAERMTGQLVQVRILVGVVAYAFATPFLRGFENIIGIVIIAIGLYEAWKINRKTDQTVTGPFRIEDASGVPSPAP